MQGNDKTTEDHTAPAASAAPEADDTAQPRRRRRAASRAAGPPVAGADDAPAETGDSAAHADRPARAGEPASPADDPITDTGGASPAAAVLFQAPTFEAPLPPKPEPEPDQSGDEPQPESRPDTKSARGEAESAADDTAGQRDQAKRDQAKRDQAKRDQAKRDQAKRDQAKRDQAKRDQAASADSGDDQDDDDDDDDGEPRRRRRRRGGRGRRKKVDTASADGGDDDSDDETSSSAKPDVDTEADAADHAPADADDHGDDSEDDGDGGTRRRRRRKRKGDSESRRTDDPPNTVVKVRDQRESDDEVTSVKGSTRLEAKKQRRREGREAGRRKPPILSEAEFLARREAVDRVMVVRQEGDLTQIGVLEDDVLVEHYVSRESQTSLIGNVYLGRVQNVLPAMEAAFVDIGRGRNAVIYAGEVDWSEREQGNGERRIEDVLKSGQSVLVQVTKDPVGHKGARLTSQISLPGRYVVYVPGGSMSGISRKLPDTERTRLKKILKQVVPDDAGVIVRTAAEGASEEELTNDVARLRDQWESIKKKSTGNGPALLQAEPDVSIKVVRDLFNEDFNKLVVSGGHAWDTINEYITTVAGSLHDRLEKWTPGDGKTDLFDAYRVNEQITKALDRKVWLPSGGSLIIDRTEAMTVIDVNTGKFTGSGGNLEETVTKNNLEAAEEIVRQLRLRDIGGIIVIDFIDMVLEANRDLVLRRLVECLGRDRTKHQVAEVTSLGLVQMTRKRIGTGLLEAFGEQCPHCRGRGLVVHDHPAESGSGSAPASGDGARGSEGKSGGRSRRGRRRSSQDSAAEKDTSAENNHKPKLEASADPSQASPADLIPAAGESADDDSTTQDGTSNGTTEPGGTSESPADHVV